MPSNISKTAVRKAGERIAQTKSEADSKDLELLNEWRMIHSVPLCSFLQDVDMICQGIDNYICMSRLKRTESIIEKLTRVDSNFKLHNLEDIAAFRIIVPTVRDVNKVSEAIKTHCNVSKTRNYVSTPKEIGYRSIHHILKAQHDHLDLLIEVQIRTFRQHAWASIIEFIDMTSSSQFKTTNSTTNNYCNLETRDIIEFMRQLGEVFYTYDSEQQADTAHSIKIPKGIHDRLKAMQEGAAHNDNRLQDGKFGYYLVTINKDEQRLDIKRVNDHELQQTLVIYNKQQPTFSNNTTDAVLVRTDRPSEISKYYPAICLDTTFILEHLNGIATL